MNKTECQIIEDCPDFMYGCCQKYLDGDCSAHKCDLKIIREQECKVLALDARVKEYNELVDKYKAKEQECEELKSDLTDLSKIIDCKNGTILTFKEQLDQLKAENEKLKKQVCGLRPELKSIINKTCSKYNIESKYYHEKIIEIINNLDKYKQTLSEIKEIAKIEYPKSLFTETFVEVINHCPYFDCGKCKCLENKEKQNCGGFICSRKQSVYYQENTIYFKQILQKISEVVE